MKYIIGLTVSLVFLFACNSTKESKEKPINKSVTKNDTLRIANDELEYEVIIIDAGFNSWMATYGKPRGFYSQAYLEARNLDWVNAWNMNFYSGRRSDFYQNTIDYQSGIDYGYEVNYLLYNYLVYFQTTNKIKLGSFVARP